MEIILILLLALAFDIIFAEPPNIVHPVAWLGKLISLELRLAPAKGRTIQFVFGAAAVLITTIAVTTSLLLFLIYLKSFNITVYIMLSALLLKFTFSIKGLIKAAEKVRNQISGHGLKEAQNSLTALVSRNTSQLNKEQAIAATVESVAENSCDSIVAPLFYFAIFGIPGAVAYRIINTFDSMIGYHGRWEYTGKFAARLDDVANYIPARITALLISGLAWLCRSNSKNAWRIMLRDHNKTESPNAGWTMSAAAGALNVQLEKAGHYTLGDRNNTLTTDTIKASLWIMTAVAVTWSIITIAIRGIYSVAA